MRTIEQIRTEHLSVEELDKEIECRHELISKMVGTLYPSILYDEISEIRRRRDE